MPLERAAFFQSGHLPQTDGRIAEAPGSKGSSIGRIGKGKHRRSRPAADSKAFLARADVPQPNGFLVAGRQRLAVRSKSDRPHGPFVSFERRAFFELTTAHIP